MLLLVYPELSETLKHHSLREFSSMALLARGKLGRYAPLHTMGFACFEAHCVRTYPGLTHSGVCTDSVSQGYVRAQCASKHAKPTAWRGVYRQSFARARRAIKQNALWWWCPKALEQLRVHQRKKHHLLQRADVFLRIWK